MSLFLSFKIGLTGLFDLIIQNSREFKLQDSELESLTNAKYNFFPVEYLLREEEHWITKSYRSIPIQNENNSHLKLDKNILQMCDGVKRLICRKEAATVVNMSTTDGLITIRNLNYDFKDEYINVYNFQTMRDPRMLRFEEQNIANESKIRLDKEDVKNMYDRKINKNIGTYPNNMYIQPRVPPSQPRPPPSQPPPSQPRPPPSQYQNVILPGRPLSNPLPRPPIQQQQQQQQQQQRQQIKRNIYRGIDMGGIM